MCFSSSCLIRSNISPRCLIPRTIVSRHGSLHPVRGTVATEAREYGSLNLGESSGSEMISLGVGTGTTGRRWWCVFALPLTPEANNRGDGKG